MFAIEIYTVKVADKVSSQYPNPESAFMKITKDVYYVQEFGVGASTFLNGITIAQRGHYSAHKVPNRPYCEYI